LLEGPDLPTKPAQFLTLLGAEPISLALVDLVLLDPPPQGLVSDLELLGQLRNVFLRESIELYGLLFDLRRVVWRWSLLFLDLLRGDSSSPL
jgi:hypothetical protein